MNLDHGMVYDAQSYRWGARETMLVDILPGHSGRLLWGDVVDTAIAVQIFLSRIPCATYVWMNENDEAKSYLGGFLLRASTSTVSSS